MYDLVNTLTLLFAAICAVAAVAGMMASRNRHMKAFLFVLLLVSLTVLGHWLVARRAARNQGASAGNTPEDSVAPPVATVPTFRVVKDIEFAEVPAGHVQEGCADTDADCDDDDRLINTYRRTRPLLVMANEVTWAQYSDCVRVLECRDNIAFTPRSLHSQSDEPVRFVNATDASSFCRWIGGRLPREDEWEYAARAGASNVQYPWGTGTPPEKIRFARRLEDGPESALSGERNAFGLRNMVGNVAEWCGSAETPDAVVVRGGSYNSDVEDLRFAARTPSDVNRMAETIGFRCVVDLP
jgi:formylglycine-generating enzyme required for sulfatase activity